MRHDGTHASYQGIPCVSVRFRNARGAHASVSEVEIPAPYLDAGGSSPYQTQSGFRWSDWNAAELAKPAAGETPDDLADGFADTPRGGFALPGRLSWEGSLVLAEDPGRPLVIPGLAVLSVDKVDVSTNEDEPVHVYKLTLVDWRFFLGRGAVPQWAFNVLRQDGTVRLDTTKAEPPGERYSLAEVAERLREGIWRHPRIARVPDAWKTDTREVEFLPFEGMATALPRFCALGETVEPCLHLDGELAFYAPGEGGVGWAPDGKGENREPIPEDHYAAEGLHWEAGWPEEYVMIVGGPRVATVAVDDAEPVLMLDGVPVLLTEQLVRGLTKGLHGLEWLSKIVVMPPSDHYVEGVPEATVKLLVEQAWWFYRVREVEHSAVDRYPDGSEGLIYTGTPGANAHLLPLLDRAGTAGGSRRAITVECYSWDVRKKRFRSVTESGSQLAQANQALAEIRQSVRTELLKRGTGLRGNPLEQKNPPLATDSFVADLARPSLRRGLSLNRMIGAQLAPADLDRQKVEALMSELRRIALLAKTLPGEAARYQQALTQKVEAESARGDGTAKIAIDLATKLVGYETKAAETSATPTGLVEDFAAGYEQLAQAAVERAARQMREARENYKARKEAGIEAGDFVERVHLRNKARAVDAGARVVSRELGVVKTSVRAGHVEREDVHDPSRTRFVPRPVRILFGAVTRPRFDRPPGVAGATQGAKTPDKFGGRDYIPAVLSERESLYTSTFQRTARGSVQQTLGAPLDRVTVIRRPWQELIPLESGAEAETGGQGPTGQGEQEQRDAAGAADRPGVSNRAQLDEDARKIALQLSNRPDRVRSAPLELPGPWPVQCDGVVSAVEIVMQKAAGVPCGFKTTLTIDATSAVPPPNQTRERGRG